MSKAKHTPGPWTFAWHNNHDMQITFACVVLGDEVKVIGSSGADVANARLIAAAPELLEALEGLLCWCQGYEADKLNPHALSHIESARAAIAKATGEQP